MPRSEGMNVRRVGSSFRIDYDATVDEIVVRTADETLALRPEAFMEAMKRRIDDDRYRPISEEKRARG